MMQYLVPILTALISSGIVAIIAWIRFRKRDRILLKKLATGNKKVEAETQKILAETDDTISEGYKKLLDLTEIHLYKKIDEVEKMEKILRDCKSEFDLIKQGYNDHEIKLNKIIDSLKLKIYDLGQEIEHLKKEYNGRHKQNDK